MDFRSIITSVGVAVEELKKENMLVVFNENSPKELAEISVLHTVEKMEKEVKSGDIVILGDKDYVVTAIGDTANNSLKSLGHCTFCFNGLDKVELPGQIELLGDGLPEITEGETFEIIFA